MRRSEIPYTGRHSTGEEYPVAPMAAGRGGDIDRHTRPARGVGSRSSNNPGGTSHRGVQPGTRTHCRSGPGARPAHARPSDRGRDRLHLAPGDHPSWLRPAWEDSRVPSSASRRPPRCGTPAARSTASSCPDSQLTVEWAVWSALGSSTAIKRHGVRAPARPTVGWAGRGTNRMIRLIANETGRAKRPCRTDVSTIDCC